MATGAALGSSVSSTAPSCQQTPTQSVALEMESQDMPRAESDATNMKEIKVDVVSGAGSAGLPKHSKLVHVLAALVAGVIAMAVAIVLADGKSVIVLKPVKDLPRATNPDLVKDGIDYRLDELLSPTYGIGLHHDQSGRTWWEIGAGKTARNLVHDLRIPVVAAALPSVIATDGLKHPVPLLDCTDLRTAGISALILGIVAEAVAILMILFHALVLAGMLPSKPAKILGSLVWLVLSIGFLVVMTLAVNVYTSEWKCDNVIIPEITLADHFEYSYGFYFAIVGYVSAVLVCVLVMFATSTTDGEAGKPVVKPSAVNVFVGIFVFVVLGLVCTLASASAHDWGDSGFTINASINPCEGQKPKNSVGFAHKGAGDKYFDNVKCFKDSVAQTLEQAGANVTLGFVGGMDAADRVPITTSYAEAGLCPVNVHWHLGAEHLSVGQFDEGGVGPDNHLYGHYADNGYAKETAPALFPKEFKFDDGYERRKLAASSTVRQGHRCHYYDDSIEMFTKNYTWKFCDKTMKVGETYEIHWPHSAAGMCGSEWQYQSPFYDGVFCRDGIINIAPLNTYEKIGVQSQVFTIVNSDDPKYYYGNLIAGAWESGDHWSDVAMYTGSTTGTTRDDYVCSRYTPVTWQVDRKCHLISASSFDKLCEDMLSKSDDMKSDTHAHGSRIPAAPELTANNQQSRS